MNTYSKFAPNVFLAKCKETYSKGEEIQVSTTNWKRKLSFLKSCGDKKEPRFCQV